VYLQLFYSGKVAQQKKLKKDILENKKELLQTSAQDQFAKWAKLRRSVDKGLSELEKLSKSSRFIHHVIFAPVCVFVCSAIDMLFVDGELSSTKTSFSLKFNTVLWILTGGLQLAVGWWYSKSAVFYLPPGWFGPLTWWLAFPFAPAGSVSCGVWQLACRRVIKMGERVVRELASGVYIHAAKSHVY
jgi:tail-anchored protein insertion receptor